jgi:NTP pyrophosphatase (non-canonical NTP hydrolase)
VQQQPEDVDREQARSYKTLPRQARTSPGATCFRPTPKTTSPLFQMNIEQITQRLHAIRDQNDWQRYHSPKNLVMAASVEMAELVEIFQWQTEDESRQLPSDKLAHAGQEVGDILMYLLLMCSELGIDMEQALLAKLADNERRFAR